MSRGSGTYCTECALTFCASSNENGSFAHPHFGLKVIFAPSFILVPLPLISNAIPILSGVYQFKTDR